VFADNRYQICEQMNSWHQSTDKFLQTSKGSFVIEKDLWQFLSCHNVYYVTNLLTFIVYIEGVNVVVVMLYYAFL